MNISKGKKKKKKLVERNKLNSGKKKRVGTKNKKMIRLASRIDVPTFSLLYNFHLIKL